MIKNHVMKKLTVVNSSSNLKHIKVVNSLKSLSSQKELKIQINNFIHGSLPFKIYQI